MLLVFNDEVENDDEKKLDGLYLHYTRDNNNIPFRTTKVAELRPKIELAKTPSCDSMRINLSIRSLKQKELGYRCASDVVLVCTIV